MFQSISPAARRVLVISISAGTAASLLTYLPSRPDLAQQMWQFVTRSCFFAFVLLALAVIFKMYHNKKEWRTIASSSARDLRLLLTVLVLGAGFAGVEASVYPTYLQLVDVGAGQFATYVIGSVTVVAAFLAVFAFIKAGKKGWWAIVIGAIVALAATIVFFEDLL